MMWLTTEDAAKKLGKSVETIRRWARKGKLPSKMQPNPKGQPYRMVDVSAVIQCGHFQNPVRSVRSPEKNPVRSFSKSSAVSAVTGKKSSAVTENEEKSSAVSAVILNDDVVPVSNSPEVSHQGADSSPAPAPIGKTQLINETEAEPLVHPLPDLAPHSEVPAEYAEIGRMKAALCLEALNKIDFGLSKTETYELITDAYNNGLLVPELLAKHGKISTRTLQRWLKKYLDHGKDYLALAPGYIIGEYRGRNITDQEEQLLVKYLFDPRKIRVGTAIRKIKQLSRLNICESPSSESTLRRAAEDLKHKYAKEWALLRKGEKYFDEHVNKTILRDWDLLEVGDVWFSDGHVLNFDIINPFTGKPKRMTLVTYFDVVSRMPLGATIQPTENTRGIALAFRNAVLNYGAPPKVVYIDNGKAFKSKFFTGSKDVDLSNDLAGLYERLGCKVIFAKAYNGKAKAQLERWHGTLDHDLQQFLSSYRGSSIENKPAYLHRNEKFIKKITNNDPLELDEAHQIVDFYVNYLYGSTPHSGLNGQKPLDILNANPPKQRIEPGELNFLMLDIEIKKINNNGIKFNKMFYWHRALVGYKKPVHIKYDWTDLRSILVYSTSGQFICQATTRTYQHPVAGHLGNEYDEQTLKREQKEIARIKKQAKEASIELIKRTNIEDVDFAKIASEKQPKLTNNSKLIEFPGIHENDDEDFAEVEVEQQKNDDLERKIDEKFNEDFGFDTE